ncbi:putative RNA recognition motif domain, nucleotide-binding alpha-beta plait domain superfamily [Helianthus annuus]|uniref:RNA recognition motif domain, nucleotide-binding alpha-beta plait domain superfamily n=1 Tax=Helianthus annuus TaxID=4232 RepID=A0A9K3P1X0_HELAN|nr:putative RNA recognition motif domain, nucleotide-binding alpha-beta plait domain superfamily [Helianthus annuus]KAJ0610700.1 putative RNA recognition motif domain, nucleotide-binding alpha-beta plait domain superfamily [Helianthus annuus]KAJ0621474.1 putative RNA recognition motif domain, nucleotide-binding alpha-beta plait domain superfamily [Helianthus annuus]KAJ0625946.1 putative RNA recognition motif domain, nucleotide-binding alpha-beta plait domain superfamily [Helianthus annuus]KAJ07
MAGKVQFSGSITKFFVTNLPEGCTPWELRSCMERCGEISGSYVAKKRDKQGNRFGFVSFKGAKDRQEMVKILGGVKMGECKLKLNVARFAVENSSAPAEPEVRVYNAKAPGQVSYGNTSNLRDARKYSDVVGTSKEGGGSIKFRDNRKEEGNKVFEKSIVVPDKTGAFSNLSGLALVGRTVDLETLVDFDRLLRIAKTIVANIQYLGGLSLLITFHDVASASSFLEHKEVWEPWFSKLDPWSGQTLPLERVAWLKLNGIPLHLFDAAVLGQVGEIFGKVLHVPMHVERESDGDYVVEEADKEAVNTEGYCMGSKEVGPEVVNRFICGSGDKSGRPKRRLFVGQKSRKAHMQSKGNSVGSLIDLRPKKRSRNSFEDTVPESRGR